MYAVYADGNLLYDTTQQDKERILLNMKICLEANTPGKFSFVMPPGHALHGSIENQKTNITVEQDGEIIYVGRVIGSDTDKFNQISVNCECALAYFLDSIQRSYEFEGTPLGLFRYLIDTHNEMVEEEQRFTIGIVTAVADSGTAQVKTEEYTDTLQELKSRMINVYGGYLRVRTVDGVHYIDYLADGDENTQEIEIGVNLLDLQKNISSDERFNVLIPKGAMQKGTNGRYTEALNIKAVNNGLDYIMDADAVAQCGKRIWKTRTWDYVEDAQTLLEKGQEYLLTGISDETTLTIKAVDMHFIDKAVQRIGILHKVRILSNPHGVDVQKVCQKIEGELIKPEEMQYTFGKPRLTLTDNIVIAKKQSGGGGSGKTLKEEVSDLKRWATMAVNENIANIELNAGQLDLLTQDFSNVMLILDGIEAELEMKVEKNGVIASINLSTEEAVIDAPRVNLKGYVTVSQLEAEIASFDYVAGDFEVVGGVSVGGVLYAGGLDIEQASFDVGDYTASWKSRTVVTGLSNLQTVNINGTYYKVLPETGLGYTTATIYYLGR